MSSAVYRDAGLLQRTSDHLRQVKELNLQDYRAGYTAVCPGAAAASKEHTWHQVENDLFKDFC